MTMRITGMYSGLDTDSIIQELVKARSVKVDNTKKGKTKLEWKQEAWTSLNTKVKSLFSSTLSKLRFSDAYKKKNTTVSNTNAVSVITGDKAMNGVQTLSVKKLAKSGYMTGAEITTKDGSKATGDTLIKDLKLKDYNGNVLNYEEGGSFTVNAGGKATRIDLNAETKISDVVTKLNEAGVSANFDEANGRIFIASAQSGADNDFAITADNLGGFSALSFLGINSANSDEENAKTAAEYEKLRTLGAQLNDKLVYVNDGEGNPTAQIDYAATMEKIESELGVESDLYKAIKENMGDSDDAFSIGIDMLKYRADFANSVESEYGDAALYSQAVRIKGQNAWIKLNGVDYYSNNNNVEVNGLTFTCFAEAENITVTTQEDTDGIYDVIRDFFKQYNEIINEMDKLYNADAAKGYEPLTDEEKDEMSDKEVEKWEQKIKDSILRKDTTLGTLASTMKQAMQEGFEVNGETMYLANFGIETMSYFLAPDNEKNAFHIAGDDKDANYSSQPDKLKAMIATDSETVISFFTQLSRNLYGKLDKLSASTDDTSKGSFFEDKKYKSDIKSYEAKIAEAEKKLAAYEDKYYKKFSQMEVALSKLQSSTSSITAMLGGGQQ